MIPYNHKGSYEPILPAQIAHGSQSFAALGSPSKQLLSYCLKVSLFRWQTSQGGRTQGSSGIKDWLHTACKTPDTIGYNAKLFPTSSQSQGISLAQEPVLNKQFLAPELYLGLACSIMWVMVIIQHIWFLFNVN